VAEKPSTLQSILINVRDAALRFADPYKQPQNIPGEVTKLLAQLGIADPGAGPRAQLNNAAANWGTIANQLSNLNLNFVDPQKALKDLSDKADTIKNSIDAILKTPEAVWQGLAQFGGVVATEFPKRLLAYIVYEALTHAHPKIGGVFLLFGVLRREFTPPLNAAFIPAEIRVFDLPQLIKVVTNPREAVLTALKWGTDDFIARPVVDGMVLLAGLAPNTTRGPDDQTLDKATENLYVKRGNDLAPLLASASHSLNVQVAAVTHTLNFVGLHRTGVGLLLKSPLTLGGNLNVLNIPPGAILALVPGANRLTDPPKVDVLTP